MNERTIEIKNLSFFITSDKYQWKYLNISRKGNAIACVETGRKKPSIHGMKSPIHAWKPDFLSLDFEGDAQRVVDKTLRDMAESCDGVGELCVAVVSYFSLFSQ